MRDAEVVAAGPFSAWLDQTMRARATSAGSDVPCGACTACCRSAYFIHIGPTETQTLRRIARALLVPAPGLPPGHVVLGFDERGHCPMLVDDRCSIYDDRPVTCRTYDCRVFSAAGLRDEDDGKPLVAERVRRWRFSYPAAVDRERHRAVEAAAAFLRCHPECFPDGALPSRAGDLAVAAIKAHAAFLTGDGRAVREPDADAVRDALSAD